MTASAKSVRPTTPAFLRLDGRIGWRMDATAGANLLADDEAGVLRLSGRSATAIAETEPGGTFGGRTRPTGLAVGPDGRLFLADPVGNRILTYTTHQRAFVPLWEPPPAVPAADGRCDLPPPAAAPDAYTLREPRGVALSRDGDLVVADTGHGRLVVYTWPGLAPRHIIPLDGGEPWDIAFDAAGRLFVADPAQGRVHRFDRLWRRDGGYEGGAGTLQQPRHLAVDATGRLWVLDEGSRSVIALDGRGRPLPEGAVRLHEQSFPPPLRLDASGLSLPQDTRPDCPALVLPGLEVDRQGRLLKTTLRLLARPPGVAFPRQGLFRSEALDSGLLNCAWHRVVLDAELPDATSLTVRTFTAATPLEPNRLNDLPLEQWSAPLTLGPGDLPEVLVQSGPGRFLWLRLELRGNGQASPLIRSITLHAPRQSSLAFLPPVFQDDPVSANFLDRFLSYFDTVFEEIESQIERFSGFLDPDGVPSGDFLTWLGGWFDLTFLAEWSDETRREFVRQAIRLYEQRGTIPGLQAFLRLHTGLDAPHPWVVEHFRLRDYPARRDIDRALCPTLGEGESDLVNGKPYLAGIALDTQPADPARLAHHFTVVLPSRAAPDADALDTLHLLIDAQKPAHTRYEVRVVQPGVRIGCQSTIGVDTLLGPYPTAPLGEMGLGQGSQLAPPAPDRPRLGTTRLQFST